MLHKNVMQLVKSIGIILILLIAFSSLFLLKNDLVNNPFNYKIKSFNGVFKSPFPVNSMYFSNITISTLDNTHNDVVNDVNNKKMDVYYAISLFVFVIGLLCIVYELRLKNYVIANQMYMVLCILMFIMFIVCTISFDKLYYDVVGNHLTYLSGCLSNTVGVLV